MKTVTVGQQLFAIGVIHNVFGFVVGSEPMLAIARDGFIGAVTDDAPWRLAIFWFECFGFMLMLLGAAWHGPERAGMLPKWAGPAIAALGVFGIAFMPLSGFWIVFAVAVVAWRRTHV